MRLYERDLVVERLSFNKYLVLFNIFYFNFIIAFKQ